MKHRLISVAIGVSGVGICFLAAWHFVVQGGGLNRFTQEEINLEAVATTWSPWTRVARCARTHQDYTGEVIHYLARGASHVKLCSVGLAYDCVVAPVDSSSLHLISTRRSRPCKLTCDELDSSRICTWLHHRKRRAFEVFLNTRSKALGLQSESTDCQPSGPWLGRMSIAQCAAKCSRWGRFVHATSGNSNCKCAEPTCKPLVDTNAGSALYQPDPKVAALMKMDTVMRLMPRKEVPYHLERCALLGSSKDLLGKGLGPEIDAHDTVIRVNRIPTLNHTQDFGTRNDILFIGPRQRRKMMYTPSGQWYWTFGGKRKLCRRRAKKCPFQMVVLKYGNGKNRAKPRNMAFPIAQVSSQVHRFARVLLGRFMKKRAVPTTGFEAFITFGLLCSEMTIYGFSGNKTADGHRFFGVHSARGVEREHELMSLLLEGDYYDPKLDKQLLHRLQERKGKHRIVHA